MLTMSSAHEYLVDMHQEIETDLSLDNIEKQIRFLSLKDADFWFNKGVIS